MAKLLVCGISRFSADPTIDSRDCQKRGDILHVAPDGWVWGRLECLPNLYIIGLDMPYSDAVKLSQPHYNPSKVVPAIDRHTGLRIKDPVTKTAMFAEESQGIKRLNRYKFDLDTISASDLSRMQNTTGLYIPTITSNQIIDKAKWQL